jgi:hypothetical protein
MMDNKPSITRSFCDHCGQLLEVTRVTSIRGAQWLCADGVAQLHDQERQRAERQRAERDRAAHAAAEHTKTEEGS